MTQESLTDDEVLQMIVATLNEQTPEDKEDGHIASSPKLPRVVFVWWKNEWYMASPILDAVTEEDE